MNTKFCYMYRDASNYKAFHSEVLDGEINLEQRNIINKSLFDGEMFIPQQVGLEPLQENMVCFPSEDDHCWHEIDSIHVTEEKPTINMTISELVNKFNDVVWDDVKYAILPEEYED